MARKTPDWVRSLVDLVSQAIEPDDFMAPVGYTCHRDEHGWLISVYPKLNELLGGAKDGKLVVPGFRLAISELAGAFDKPPEILWHTPSEYQGEYDGPCVAFVGYIQDLDVELVIYDQPPSVAKVGMLVDWQRNEARPCKRSG